MTELSDEQRHIVGLPLGPLAITACAGSGKTKTAVHRLAAMRRLVKDPHSRIALLSFSNVAVDTFRKEYVGLAKGTTTGVDIDTVDAFITGNVLRPHAYRTMGCTRTPFLVEGREPFLTNFTFFDGERSRPTTDLIVGIENRKFAFSAGRSHKKIDAEVAKKALAALGKKGAYTHGTAPYWVIRTLVAQPFVWSALARRYPHILVDEAQDIGPTHEIILRMLVKEGSELSLIGDPHQGIFEFSSADGKFLAQYGQKAGVTSKVLGTNFRSVPEIVAIANCLSGRKDEADRSATEGFAGAYYLPYKRTDKDRALAAFASMLESAGIPTAEGVVLCRGNDWAVEWGGGGKSQGQKVVRAFAEATIARDQLGRFGEAFRLACVGVAGLLHPQHDDLVAKLSRPAGEPGITAMRRIIWSFVRDTVAGLPSGSLVANTEWHAALLPRARALVEGLCGSFGLTAAESLGLRLKKTDLLGKPLVPPLDLAQPERPQFRVSTVHKVKGESLNGVMYVVSKDQAVELLDGTKSEVGRIGYVAVTRARNLFVLAVPESSLDLLEPKLVNAGFKKPGV